VECSRGFPACAIGCVSRLMFDVCQCLPVFASVLSTFWTPPPIAKLYIFYFRLLALLDGFSENKRGCKRAQKNIIRHISKFSK
jgi:hypothetical protein